MIACPWCCGTVVLLCLDPTVLSMGTFWWCLNTWFVLSAIIVNGHHSNRQVNDLLLLQENVSDSCDSCTKVGIRHNTFGECQCTQKCDFSWPNKTNDFLSTALKVLVLDFFLHGQIPKLVKTSRGRILLSPQLQGWGHCARVHNMHPQCLLRGGEDVKITL